MFKLSQEAKDFAKKHNSDFMPEQLHQKQKRKNSRKQRRKYRKHGIDDSITWNLDYSSLTYLMYLTNNKPLFVGDLQHKQMSQLLEELDDWGSIPNYQKIQNEIEQAIAGSWGLLTHNQINDFLNFMNITLKWYRDYDIINLNFHKIKVTLPNGKTITKSQAFWTDWLIERSSFAKNTEDIIAFFKVWSQVYQIFWN